MNGKIDNVILIGSPVVDIGKYDASISLIYGGWDILSHNIGFGYNIYFAGWIGHSDYFNKKNINKVANIVCSIIN